MPQSIKHLASGAAKYAFAKTFLAETDASINRIAVCNACEQLTPNRTCSICGCKVDQKAKYESETCPLAQVIGVEHRTASDAIRLLDKWADVFIKSVRTGFALEGDVVIMPRENEIINLRTKETTRPNG